MLSQITLWMMLLFFVGCNTPGISASISHNNDWTPIEKVFDGVPMMFVPVGCFDMGASEEEYQAGRASFYDQPQHEICFDKPFWIDKFEVYQSQFETLKGKKDQENWFLGGELPVESIAWEEANKFCGLRKSRLPTEPEWEYSARGPDSLNYPWGDSFDDNYLIWNRGEDYQGPSPVGSIPEGKSWIGALDMAGNIAEWSYSTIGSDNSTELMSNIDYLYPYIPTDGREDGNHGNNILKSTRGGSWYDSEIHPFFPNQSASFRLATYHRGIFSSGIDNLSKTAMLGFRCVRDYVEGDLER